MAFATRTAFSTAFPGCSVSSFTTRSAPTLCAVAGERRLSAASINTAASATLTKTVPPPLSTTAVCASRTARRNRSLNARVPITALAAVLIRGRTGARSPPPAETTAPVSRSATSSWTAGSRRAAAARSAKGPDRSTARPAYERTSASTASTTAATPSSRLAIGRPIGLAANITVAGTVVRLDPPPRRKAIAQSRRAKLAGVGVAQVGTQRAGHLCAGPAPADRRGAGRRAHVPTAAPMLIPHASGVHTSFARFDVGGTSRPLPAARPAGIKRRVSSV